MHKEYRYTECGLDNIVIVGVDFLTADDGEKVLVIPAINQLHALIAEGIIRRSGRMSGKELRFLRTEMGLTQKNLAELLHRDAQSIARWEKGEVEIDGNADTFVRLLAEERLGLRGAGGVEATSRRSARAKGDPIIRIRAEEDGHYELMDAA